MDELISRKTLMEKYNRICENCGENKKYDGVMCGSCLLDDAISIVEDLPSEEPEIIYCKDCKYVDGDAPISDGRYWCYILQGFMQYCSEGVKNR